MKTVLLFRSIPTKDGTFGNLLVPDLNWCCATLEPEWYYNKKDVSCINTGDYICKYTKSNRLGYKTYEVQDLIGRSGIRIHKFNYVRESTGCIGLGRRDIFNGKNCILQSEDTIHDFENLLNRADFNFKIRWACE